MTDFSSPLLKVENLTTTFPIYEGRLFRRVVGEVTAVKDVGFSLEIGETLAIVGESGCGKSTLARSVLQLLPIAKGRVFFKGVDIAAAAERRSRRWRLGAQMVFQDPYASLDPRMTVGDILAEPSRLVGVRSRAALREKAEALSRAVGLDPKRLRHYPHEFSGGQRQRISIARALAVQPELLIADEPVSALDVSVQAQILNLLRDIKRDYRLSMLFISHNLAVVRHVADRVAVMYAGRFMESAPVEKLFAAPAHPYSKALLAAVPEPDPRVERRRKPRVAADEKDAFQGPAPDGCPYRRVCGRADAATCSTAPEPRPFQGDPNHTVACHFPNAN